MRAIYWRASVYWHASNASNNTRRGRFIVPIADLSARRGGVGLAREVAGGVVIRLLFLQYGDHLAADCLSLPAARVEIAATRWIDRTGHIAFEDDAFAP